MNHRHYILFFISTIFILLQFLLTPNIINGNDLNGNIVPLLHFKESILINLQFPQWNPYIHQGIPAIADPLYGIYNPIISLPVLLFDYQLAIKVMYFIAVFLSCISMFSLLKLFKISEKLSMIIAITYASGTYLFSRIIAGHLEKVISYGFLPLFIFCLIRTIQRKNILWSGLTAIVISLILFTGDIYNAMYCLYSLFTLLLFYLFKDKKISLYLFLALLLFLLFSSIKILPMLELQHYISKVKEPFVGGLNAITFLTNLFFPYEKVLSPFFPPIYFSTGFGWWESLTFIGPFSLLGLFFIFRSAFKKHSKELSVLIILTILFLFLSSPESKLNPYHYLISSIGVLQYFHVPSRILALWSVVILVCLGLSLNQWKRKNIAYVLLTINLLIVFTYSQLIFQTTEFKKELKAMHAPIAWIKNHNPNQYYSVHLTSQSDIPQDIAYLNHLLILQSNYGLFLKGSLGEKYAFRGDKSYEDLKPGFLITSANINNSELEKIKTYDNHINIYKDSKALPFALIADKSQKAYFSPNKIAVLANSNEKNRLILLESNYPGWKAFIDGNRTEILPGRFLEVTTLPGTHRYEFVFASTTFFCGLLLSLISLFSWGFYILYNRNIVSKKRFKKM